MYRRGVRTRKQLDEALRGRPAAPADRGTVRLVVARLGGGEHRVLERGRITVERGLVGDRWIDKEPPDPRQQVTVMERWVAELVADGGPLDGPGDNLLVDLDLSEGAAPPGTRLRAGTCLLEVSDKPHTGCKKFMQRFGLDAVKWIGDPAHAERRLRGINCRVVESGEVGPGDEIVNLGPAT